MRNVLVTGGSRGLGLAIARKLRGAGYRVIAMARAESEELTAAMPRPSAQAARFISCPSISARLAAIPDLVRELRKEFGPI